MGVPWQMTVTTAWIAGKRIEAFDETVLSPNIHQLFYNHFVSTPQEQFHHQRYRI
jgi:hypothetical protein